MGVQELKNVKPKTLYLRHDQIAVLQNLVQSGVFSSESNAIRAIFDTGVQWTAPEIYAARKNNYKQK